MYKLLLAVAAAALGVTSAAEAETRDWSGWYAGVNAGQADPATFDLEAALLLPTTTTFFPVPLRGRTFVTRRSFEGDGSAYGVQGGYNVQRGAFVYGGEVDFQTTDIESSISIAGAPGGAANNPTGFTDLAFGIDYITTARARGGFALGPVLAYGTAGVAVGKVEFDRNYRVDSNEIRDSAESTRLGFVYGGGAELAVTERFSIGAEYSKVELGEDEFNTIYTDGTVGLARIDTEFDVIRARVNLRF